MSLKPDFGVGTLKDGDFAGYVDCLVVEHHADDVEAGLRVRETEVSRFVYENAQDGGDRPCGYSTYCRQDCIVKHKRNHPNIRYAVVISGKTTIAVRDNELAE